MSHLSKKKFGNFYRGPQTSFCNSERNPVPALLFNNLFDNLPSVLPNSEESGEPNPSNTKKYLSNIEYNLFDKHVEYSDQHMGAEHSIFGNKDDEFLKILG